MRNVGKLDSSIRLLLGAAILGLSATIIDRPFLAIAVAVTGLAVLASGVGRFDPLYFLLYKSTHASRPEAAAKSPDASRRPRG